MRNIGFRWPQKKESLSDSHIKKNRKKKLNSIKLAEENFKPFGLLQTYCNFLIFNKADLDKFQRFCQGLCLELKIVFALILKVNA